MPGALSESKRNLCRLRILCKAMHTRETATSGCQKVFSLLKLASYLKQFHPPLT